VKVQQVARRLQPLTTRSKKVRHAANVTSAACELGGRLAACFCQFQNEVYGGLSYGWVANRGQSLNKSNPFLRGESTIV